MATSAPLWSPPPLRPRERSMVNSRVMVVAVAVLFAVVIFTLCLHLYAKWFWRHRARTILFTDFTDVHMLHWPRAEAYAPNAAPTVGLERALVEALPMFEISGENKFECAVCLEDFEAGEKGRTLPLCGHAFHLDCIDMWLHSHSTCPLCRASIIAVDTKPAELQPQEATIVGAPFMAASRSVSSLNSLPRTAEDRDEGENRGTETDTTVTTTETRILPQNLKEYESRPAGSGIRAPFQVTIDIPISSGFGSSSSSSNNNNNTSSSSNPASVMSPMARASASFRWLMSRSKSVVTPPTDEGGPSSPPPPPAIA